MIKKYLILIFFFLFFNFGEAKEKNKEFEINQMLLKKNPNIALKWAFIPGCGQFYNEKYLKGIIAISLETISFSKSIYWENERKKAFSNNEIFVSDNAKTKRNWSYAISFWIWLYFVMDAYVDAHFSFQDFSKNEISYSNLEKKSLENCKVFLIEPNKIIFQLSEKF